jgi:hypothetical protein
VSIVETPNFKEMDIGKLRQYASHLRVAIPKTATKQDIIEAIDRKLQGRTVPELADAASTVKPGYAKIRVLSDPMPEASNMPVFVMSNLYTCMIPRDVDVIVPHKVVRALNDSVVLVTKQTQDPVTGGFKETQVKSIQYPFQVIESTPGPEVRTAYEEGKLRTAGPKRRYRTMFGRWPTPRELTGAIERGFIQLGEEEVLDSSAEKLIGVPEAQNA